MGCYESRDNGGLVTEDFLPTPVIAKRIDAARPAGELSEAREVEISGAAKHLCDLDLVHFSQPLQLYTTKSIDDVYEIERLELIGQGGLGTVRKAVHKHTQAVRAVKIISPHALKVVGMKALQHEVGIMRTLDHPHIIKLYEVFHDACVYLITELCTGGELFDRIVQEAGFTESRAAEVMRQILLATKYLHMQGIVHRDLKPENLMLHDPSPEALIKVIDFGLAAKIKEGGELTARVGTTRYVAPEVLTGSYAHKADIWSCGVVCFILLSGSPPFHGQDAEMMAQIMQAKYSFPQESWNEVSEEAKDFIRTMLKFGDDRPDAAELLQHGWIQQWTERPDRSLSKRLLSKLKLFNCSRRKAKNL